MKADGNPPKYFGKNHSQPCAFTLETPPPSETALQASNTFEVATLLDGVKIGFIGVTMPLKSTSYATATEPKKEDEDAYSKLIAQYPDLSGVVALTHMPLEDDKRLAETLLSDPNSKLIALMGGHEHDAKFLPAFGRTAKRAMITKADANAKSAVVHTIRKGAAQEAIVSSELVHLHGTPTDQETQALVDQWIEFVFSSLEKSGLKPREPIAQLDHAMEATEYAVRNKDTEIGTNIVEAMLNHSCENQPKPQASLFLGGGIRLDDSFGPGILTQYDFIRLLPFPDSTELLSVPGKVILALTEPSEIKKRVGKGSYLIFGGVTFHTDGSRSIGQEEILPNKTYRVITTAYLANRAGPNTPEDLLQQIPELTQVARIGSCPRSAREMLMLHFAKKFPLKK